jgi:hypothetical protein
LQRAILSQKKYKTTAGRESKVIHPIIEMREYEASNTINSDDITLYTWTIGGREGLGYDCPRL